MLGSMERTPPMTKPWQGWLHSRLWNLALTAALALALTASALSAPAVSPTASVPSSRAEILWDTWGVPHIFARDLDNLGHAFGRAQMEAHANLMLHLYGEARGRSAEYWGGSENLQRDRLLHTFGLTDIAQNWLQRQDPEFRGFLQAFVEGVNAYASDHPDEIAASEKLVLPITATDVLAHLIRAIHLTFVAGINGAPDAIKRWEGTPGSNAWAVSGKRSASGHTLLLANPHLPWNGLFVFFESHWNAPGLNGYGATLVGMPVMAIAFNQNLGWTHTVNQFDGSDLYELTLDGSGYRWDDGVKPFDLTERILKSRQPDGTFKEEKLTIRRSVHGPVVGEKPGRALAARIVGLDSPGLGQEYLDLLRARNLGQFEEALSRLQMPMFTVMYADRDGHIMHLFGGQTPVRPPGPYRWSGIVPGNTSATLWTRTLPYEKLPRVLDPESGWLQNANDPPWTTTFPRAIDPNQFPTYVSPRNMGLRPQRSAELLRASSRLTLEQFIAAKHDTRSELADRILPDLLAASARMDSPKGREAIDVLQAWDRNTDTTSRGAELFRIFVQEISERNNGRMPFATTWDESRPLETPRGLADPSAALLALDAAADKLKAEHKPLDIAWGDVHRLRRGSVDLPSNGGADGLGIFRAAWDRPARDGRFEVTGGDTYICAIEFSTPVRAMAAIGYGNASQPRSKHVSDQLELFSRKALRPVWLTRSEIETHLEKRESF